MVRMSETVVPGLERRLRAERVGDVMFDRFARGRYATDASHYQVMPRGVVAPRTIEDANRAIAIAKEEGVSVTARGGGTSQCGQTINTSLIVDCSKYLNRILDLDVAGRRCVVEPGIVLDDLNRQLKPHGLWFPVDISTASRATIGGMAGNNSCGARSLRYGVTRDNVLSIDAVLADGERVHFGPVAAGLADVPTSVQPLARDLLSIGVREAEEIAARFPNVQRRVGGYNLDALAPNAPVHNLAHILVGSEGTLGFSTRIELKLSPLLGRRAVGACHFGRFYDAMDAAQHIVKLAPIAVELVDRTMISLARDIAMFRPTLEQFVRGDPDAVLLVEFAEEDWDENLRRLARLGSLMGDLGFAWDKEGAQRGGVVEVLDPKLQGAITEVRTAGLNIMMSRPAVRTSVIAPCSLGSSTSTTPPRCAPSLSQAKPRSPMSAASRFRRRRFSSQSSSANSTSSTASGSPRTNCSTVGRKIAMSRASAIMVRSTSSTAIGASLTMCCAASIAS